MYTNEEILIRNILGPSTSNIRPFAKAVKLTKEFVFLKKVPTDEIRVTTDIYEPVAVELQREPRTVSRQIERAANLCWSIMTDEQKKRYIGRTLPDIGAPRDMLFYLAFYSRFGKPYYVLMEERVSVLAEFSGL